MNQYYQYRHLDSAFHFFLILYVGQNSFSFMFHGMFIIYMNFLFPKIALFFLIFLIFIFSKKSASYLNGLESL